MNQYRPILLEFKECLESIAQTVRFESSVLGTHSALQLRLIHQARADLHLFISLAEPEIDPTQLEHLNRLLRAALSDHLNPGQDAVPNRLLRLTGGFAHLPIPKFAKGLVRVAALFGSDRATQMLTDWIGNKPIRYWRHIVLVGLSVEQILDVNPSLRIISLPNSSNQLAQHLPYSLRGFHHGDAVYINKAKLLVEHEYSIPLKDGSLGEAEDTCLGIPNFSIDEFCECLALATNQYVSWLAMWNELEEWDVFGSNGGGVSYRDSLDSGTATAYLDQLAEAYCLFTLGRPTGSSGERLSIALSRWVNSKRQKTTLVDQCIDLRIALETLYLPDASGEARFRVSTHGAWHLGKDFSSRSRYQKTLRDAYDLASKAVHSGEVEPTDTNRKLLGEAQDLCRAAILKRLRDSEEPRWSELILGKG